MAEFGVKKTESGVPEGTSIRDLVRSATGMPGSERNVPAGRLEDSLRSLGYRERDVKKMSKAWNTIQQNPERDFVIHGDGTFSVTDSGQPVSKRSGRAKGNVKGLDIGDLIGLGNNVSILAGAMEDQIGAMQAAETASFDEIAEGINKDVQDFIDNDQVTIDEFVPIPTGEEKKAGKTTGGTGKGGAGATGGAGAGSPSNPVATRTLPSGEVVVQLEKQGPWIKQDGTIHSPFVPTPGGYGPDTDPGPQPEGAPEEVNVADLVRNPGVFETTGSILGLSNESTLADIGAEVDDLFASTFGAEPESLRGDLNRRNRGLESVRNADNFTPLPEYERDPETGEILYEDPNWWNNIIGQEQGAPKLAGDRTFAQVNYLQDLGLVGPGAGGITGITKGIPGINKLNPLMKKAANKIGPKLKRWFGPGTRQEQYAQAKSGLENARGNFASEKAYKQALDDLNRRFGDLFFDASKTVNKSIPKQIPMTSSARGNFATGPQRTFYGQQRTTTGEAADLAAKKARTNAARLKTRTINAAKKPVPQGANTLQSNLSSNLSQAKVNAELKAFQGAGRKKGILSDGTRVRIGNKSKTWEIYKPGGKMKTKFSY